MDNILKTLVEFPSVVGDREAINPAIEWIDRYLSERGMHVKRFDYDGVESIVATTRKTKKPKVLLAAHVDVVPAPKAQFKFHEKNGRYYGRGAADMKFAIAAYLQLIDDLQGSLHDYDIGVMITSDEEVGGMHGTKALIDEGYRADVVILPDAGDTPDNWKLERSAKGIMRIEVKTSGKASHGSRPWKGENAIDKLISLLGDIRTLFPEPEVAANTLTVSIITGGEAANQVPASASAQLDIKTISDEDAEHLQKSISQMCEERGADMVQSVFGNACRTDTDSPFVAKFVETIEEVAGKGSLTEADSTGASDARFFAATGVPCIVASPPADGYHADNEYVSKEGLEQLRKVLRSYVDKIAKD